MSPPVTVSTPLPRSVSLLAFRPSPAASIVMVPSAMVSESLPRIPSSTLVTLMSERIPEVVLSDDGVGEVGCHVQPCRCR